MSTVTDSALKRYHWNALDRASRRDVLARPPSDTGGRQRTVAEIIDAVRDSGDAALETLTRRLDGVSPQWDAVTQETMAAALASIPDDLAGALTAAAERITAFHDTDRPVDRRLETADGLVCESRYVPLSPVGLYVPGGSAPLVSSVLMLAIPARLAGCERIVLCTPPDEGGGVPTAIQAAAALSGVTDVFPIGGAQAIAAMAFGTERIPRCRKLFGPGNAWVTEAKRQVALDPRGAPIDMPAGPSEVMVVADEGADPIAVAWDLLAQAEHGPDSQVLLVTDSTGLAERVADETQRLARDLPRSAILEESLASARLLIVDALTDALKIIEAYAPEHLILNCDGAADLAGRVRSAGSVFVGPWTPESLGDYCSGTNHVLPTDGHARAWGALGTGDFMRRMTLQQASERGLAVAGPDAERLAAEEGLDAHRMAVRYRLDAMAGERP